MRLPQYSPECCDPDPCICPETICKMLPDIKKDFIKLYQRHSRIMTKRERIHRLAEPKPRLTEPKYKQRCPCRDGESRKTEIIRMEEPPHTRTEQLAYPQASKLVGLKSNTVFEQFDKKRKGSVNRLLHRSLHSMYSRLANVHPPKAPTIQPKWTKEERLVHSAYDKLLAKPKKLHPPPRIMPKHAPAGGLKRLHKLCKPKSVVDLSLPEWHLTNEMRWYEPTTRILKMSKPKFYDKFDSDRRDRDMMDRALSYRATRRVKLLAYPRRFYKKDVIMENPFTVSKNALKAKPTKRILELSEAKEYDDIHTRSHPFAVSRNALKARMTPRLLELSKPKQYAR